MAVFFRVLRGAEDIASVTFRNCCCYAVRLPYPSCLIHGSSNPVGLQISLSIGAGLCAHLHDHIAFPSTSLARIAPTFPYLALRTLAPCVVRPAKVLCPANRSFESVGQGVYLVLLAHDEPIAPIFATPSRPHSPGSHPRTDGSVRARHVGT